MLPELKLSFLYKEISKKTGIPEEKISSVYDFYKNHVEDEFKTKTVIYLPKLGRFETDYKACMKQWRKLEMFIISFFFHKNQTFHL